MNKCVICMEIEKMHYFLPTWELSRPYKMVLVILSKGSSLDILVLRTMTIIFLWSMNSSHELKLLYLFS